MELTRDVHATKCVVYGFRCDSCKITVPEECGNPLGGMTVRAEGGYGAYYDRDAQFHLCRACFEKLLACFPFLVDVFEIEVHSGDSAI
jgi:hypothetical protein